jgi:D-alanyl-D-alanine carboxypeptidase/D-alanyl-D-alanine-endopeptidase (penicillin-binding protein 4)
MRLITFLILTTLLWTSCSLPRRTTQATREHLLRDSALSQAHVGIALFDPSTRKWLYRHQADRFFVPASNTKIITCYAAMKHLGDSLDGIEWQELDHSIYLFPTGDPTLLHPDYQTHRVADFLRSTEKPLRLVTDAWKTTPLGSGWSWDDYSAYYLAERSPLPVYGNVIRWTQSVGRKEQPTHPGDTVDVFITSEPEVEWPVDFTAPDPRGRFSVERDRDANRFTITEGRRDGEMIEVPYVTQVSGSAIQLLRDTLHRDIYPVKELPASSGSHQRNVIRSRPLDSMLRPLMLRSDNFYAEQTLLMTARRLTGRFSEGAATDMLLKTTFAGMPHRPRWADGSGLSRYNLFTPADFVWVLDRMRADFGLERVQGIFPTPGIGTLRSYGPDLTGRIYAKTGTLSGVVALSGFVKADSGRWLIFSLLVNNHRGSSTDIRKRFEAYLREVMALY